MDGCWILFQLGCSADHCPRNLRKLGAFHWIDYSLDLSLLCYRFDVDVSPTDAHTLWKLLGRRFPCTRKATEQNADCVGFGTLNGCDLCFALVADKTALTVGIHKALFVRPKTIKIPWDQIEISRVGANYDGAYFAVVSVPSIHGCEMVLPWRRKFAKILDQVELAGSPAVA